MNQNTPNLRLALRWPHPCSLLIEWGSRGCPPNVNLQPRVVLDTQVWLPARDEDGRSCHPSSGIMTNSRGERMTKALERTEASQQTPSTIRSEKPEGADKVYTNSHMRLVEFSHVALEDPLATEIGLWLKLILLIITIELNWKKLYLNKEFICLYWFKISIIIN